MQLIKLLVTLATMGQLGTPAEVTTASVGWATDQEGIFSLYVHITPETTAQMADGVGELPLMIPDYVRDEVKQVIVKVTRQPPPREPSREEMIERFRRRPSNVRTLQDNGVGGFADLDRSPPNGSAIVPTRSATPTETAEPQESGTWNPPTAPPMRDRDAPTSTVPSRDRDRDQPGPYSGSGLGGSGLGGSGLGGSGLGGLGSGFPPASGTTPSSIRPPDWESPSTSSSPIMPSGDTGGWKPDTPPMGLGPPSLSAPTRPPTNPAASGRPDSVQTGVPPTTTPVIDPNSSKPTTAVVDYEQYLRDRWRLEQLEQRYRELSQNNSNLVAQGGSGRPTPIRPPLVDDWEPAAGASTRPVADTRPSGDRGNETDSASGRTSSQEGWLQFFFLLSFAVNLYLGVLIYKLLNRYRSLLASARGAGHLSSGLSSS
jgi:hypothetical protein